MPGRATNASNPFVLNEAREQACRSHSPGPARRRGARDQERAHGQCHDERVHGVVARDQDAGRKYGWVTPPERGEIAVQPLRQNEQRAIPAMPASACGNAIASCRSRAAATRLQPQGQWRLSPAKVQTGRTTRKEVVQDLSCCGPCRIEGCPLRAQVHAADTRRPRECGPALTDACSRSARAAEKGGQSSRIVRVRQDLGHPNAADPWTIPAAFR
jgi:hypothetical protein